MNGKIRLKVPATSANLGAGFDAIGIALTMYCYATFRATQSGLKITGCPEEYRNADNLAAQAFRAVERYIGAGHRGIEIEIDSDIPVARGLGSSAVMLVAGAFAANEIYGRPLTKEQLLEVTNEFEGHPDNLAPAIYGGLCASVADPGKLPISAHYHVSEDLRFVALVPDYPISTNEARKALPTQIPFQDAVYNISRLSILPRALESGDTQLIAAALDDKLHQPSRAKLIGCYDLVRERALDSGAAGVVISGSGPAMLCVLKASEAEGFVTRMHRMLAALDHAWDVHILDCDPEGARTI
ncbi:MAG: homoserine kinase [Christensenellales bacterium]|jgi:homoserine kinase